MTRSSFAIVSFLAIWHAWAQPLQPRTGWVFVPGAQDMIQAGQWGCTSVTVSGDTLSIAASSGNYNTVIDTSGPTLKLQGDFSVLATLSDTGTAGSFLTMVGTLNTGSVYWTGLKRLDVGRSGNAIQVNYWTGTSANPTAQSFAIPSGVSDPIEFEVARVGTEIAVFANGSQAGSFADPGLFSSGQVYFGFNVSPGDTLNVLALAAAMPAGSSTSLAALDLQVANRTGSGLRDLAAPAGLLIGAAADAPYFSDPNYVQALGGEYNLIVPENDLKFAETEPALDQYNFCPADQLLAFAQAILPAGAETGIGAANTRLFAAETVDIFARRQGPAGSSRALGWDTPSDQSTSGKYFSPHSIGHLGYSGCSLWIDLDAAISVVLLTNRTWPDRQSQLIREVRPAFHNALREKL